MGVTAEEIRSIATAVRSEIISEMERKGMIWFPKNLAEQRLEEIELQQRQKKALRKTALEFREIAEAELWGPVDVASVRAYAHKYAKPNEIFPSSKGKLPRYKIIRAAVIRLAKKKGYAPDYLPELQS